MYRRNRATKKYQIGANERRIPATCQYALLSERHIYRILYLLVFEEFILSYAQSDLVWLPLVLKTGFLRLEKPPTLDKCTRPEDLQPPEHLGTAVGSSCLLVAKVNKKHVVGDLYNFARKTQRVLQNACKTTMRASQHHGLCSSSSSKYFRRYLMYRELCICVARQL